MKIIPAVGILHKLRNNLNEKANVMIYQLLIHSLLNYLAVIYAHNKDSSSLKSIQYLENKALRIVYNLPITYLIVSLYKDVCKKIFSVYGLHEYQTSRVAFKNIHSIGHCTIPFQPYIHIWSLQVFSQDY